MDFSYLLRGEMDYKSLEERFKELHDSWTLEDRQKIADETPYEWEECAKCGRSEKAYFIETGYSMLTWHVKIGMLCEDCYGDYEDEDDEC